MLVQLDSPQDSMMDPGYSVDDVRMRRVSHRRGPHRCIGRPDCHSYG